MARYEFEEFSTIGPDDDSAMLERSKAFYEHLRKRRTIRDYSTRAIPREVIENCLMAAGTAPNGANHQPWHFVVVETAEVKKQIREAAEVEEREFYHRRAPQEWLDALEPLGTNEEKGFLEKAPYLIAIFAQKKAPLEEAPSEEEFKKNYYVTESVGIATGMLITALHDAGLSTLTHTPSPMKFMNKILNRPDYERPFLLLVVGKAAEGAVVPKITKKPLSEISTFI